MEDVIMLIPKFSLSRISTNLVMLVIISGLIVWVPVFVINQFWNPNPESSNFLSVFWIFGATKSFLTFLSLSVFFWITSEYWDQLVLEIDSQHAENYKNYFTGEIVTFGSGMSVKYIWEIPEKKGSYEIKKHVINVEEDYPTKSTQKIIFKTVFTVILDITNLGKFQENTGKNTEEKIETIKKSIIASIKTIQSSLVFERETPEDCKRDATIIAEETRQYIELHQREIETENGIEITGIKFPDPDYHEDYQKLLNKKRQSELVQETAERIFKEAGGKVDRTRNDGLVVRRQGETSWVESQEQSRVELGIVKGSQIHSKSAGDGKIIMEVNGN